jgi:hypothetical protein
MIFVHLHEYSSFMWATYSSRGVLSNIYKHKEATEMCGKPAIRVRVTSVEEDETHYGWLKEGHDEVTLIQPSLVQLKICFAYGLQAAIDSEQGLPVKLKVEEAQ